MQASTLDRLGPLGGLSQSYKYTEASNWNPTPSSTQNPVLNGLPDILTQATGQFRAFENAGVRLSDSQAYRKTNLLIMHPNETFPSGRVEPLQLLLLTSISKGCSTFSYYVCPARSAICG